MYKVRLILSSKLMITIILRIYTNKYKFNILTIVIFVVLYRISKKKTLVQIINFISFKYILWHSLYYFKININEDIIYPQKGTNLKFHT